MGFFCYIMSGYVTFCYIMSCYVTKLNSYSSRQYIFCLCNPSQALDCLNTADSCIFLLFVALCELCSSYFLDIGSSELGIFFQCYFMLCHPADFPIISCQIISPCSSDFLGIGSSECGVFCNVMSCYVTKLNYTCFPPYILPM